MEEVEQAISLETKDPDEALKLYHDITNQTVNSDDELKIKAVEHGLSSMGKAFIIQYIVFSESLIFHKKEKAAVHQKWQSYWGV